MIVPPKRRLDGQGYSGWGMQKQIMSPSHRLHETSIADNIHTPDKHSKSWPTFFSTTTISVCPAYCSLHYPRPDPSSSRGPNPPLTPYAKSFY